MKKQILVISAYMLVVFTACGQENHEHHNHNHSTTDKKEETHDVNNQIEHSSVSVKEIVSKYLELKNALVADNTNQAADAGKSLEAAFKNFDTQGLSAEQKKVYNDIADDAKEHGEHIGANAGNISHQREHFDMLSNDIYELVKVFDGGMTLYKEYCPMYNDKKGAIWLSESSSIKNPYYGKKMLTCGSMKEEIK